MSESGISLPETGTDSPESDIVHPVNTASMSVTDILPSATDTGLSVTDIVQPWNLAAKWNNVRKPVPRWNRFENSGMGMMGRYSVRIDFFMDMPVFRYFYTGKLELSFRTHKNQRS
jgi:hypothetical protein